MEPLARVDLLVSSLHENKETLLLELGQIKGSPLEALFAPIAVVTALATVS